MRVGNQLRQALWRQHQERRIIEFDNKDGDEYVSGYGTSDLCKDTVRILQKSAPGYFRGVALAYFLCGFVTAEIVTLIIWAMP